MTKRTRKTLDEDSSEDTVTSGNTSERQQLIPHAHSSGSLTQPTLQLMAGPAQNMQAQVLEDPRRTKNLTPFLVGLIDMLKKPAECGDAITWSIDGESVVIWDTQMKLQQMLQKYCFSDQWRSFCRQMNYHGFRMSKLNIPTNAHCLFVHPEFKQGIDPASLPPLRSKQPRAGNQGGAVGG